MASQRIDERQSAVRTCGLLAACQRHLTQPDTAWCCFWATMHAFFCSSLLQVLRQDIPFGWMLSARAFAHELREPEAYFEKIAPKPQFGLTIFRSNGRLVAGSW